MCTFFVYLRTHMHPYRSEHAFTQHVFICVYTYHVHASMEVRNTKARARQTLAKTIWTFSLSMVPQPAGQASAPRGHSLAVRSACGISAILAVGPWDLLRKTIQRVSIGTPFFKRSAGLGPQRRPRRKPMLSNFGP